MKERMFEELQVSRKKNWLWTQDYKNAASAALLQSRVDRDFVLSFGIENDSFEQTGNSEMSNS